jgi:acyl-CoA reductase-like NAD-dependent aldehyde dehydrogenase
MVREQIRNISSTLKHTPSGAFFNSGQSCCAIEVLLLTCLSGHCITYFVFQRIYVHESLYDEFVQKYADIVKVCWGGYEYLNSHLDVLHQTYKLGDPTLPETNLGPVVSVASAERIRKQIADAGMSRPFMHFPTGQCSQSVLVQGP